MSNFVDKPHFSNSLWIAMETMHFHIAHAFLRQLLSHSGGLNEQFGNHETLSWRRQGNLNWMPGIAYVMIKQSDDSMVILGGFNPQILDAVTKNNVTTSRSISICDACSTVLYTTGYICCDHWKPRTTFSQLDNI